MQTTALAESARVALHRQDWVGAQRHMALLLRLQPRDPVLLLGSALALHNQAWLGSSEGWSRAATRTSLDRIEMELRAMALMDSASICARDLDEWARARKRIGQAYQHVGLYTDALDVYREIEERDPAFMEAGLLRAAIVRELGTTRE